MDSPNRELIIEIPYGGFGDHLFHSHLPRVAKESGQYEKVYFSIKSLIRQQDHLELIWKLNPFVDGFVDKNGTTCDLIKIVSRAEKNSEFNLLDLVMLDFGMDDGKRWHEPELFYKPKLIPEYQTPIFDPNHFTYIGDFNKSDLYSYLRAHKISFHAVMKLRGNKALYKTNPKHIVIDAPDVFSFCDVLFSAKQIYCFTSGTATLSAALGKNAIVFYGDKINTGFHHSKFHKYCFVKHCLKTRFLNFIKNIAKFPMKCFFIIRKGASPL